MGLLLLLLRYCYYCVPFIKIRKQEITDIHIATDTQSLQLSLKGESSGGFRVHLRRGGADVREIPK